VLTFELDALTPLSSLPCQPGPLRRPNRRLYDAYHLCRWSLLRLVERSVGRGARALGGMRTSDLLIRAQSHSRRDQFAWRERAEIDMYIVLHRAHQLCLWCASTVAARVPRIDADNDGVACQSRAAAEACTSIRRWQ
jgi:hypothetical protein